MTDPEGIEALGRRAVVLDGQLTAIHEAFSALVTHAESDSQGMLLYTKVYGDWEKLRRSVMAYAVFKEENG